MNFNTSFIDGSSGVGVDIGNDIYVSKEYVNEQYSSLLPFISKPQLMVWGDSNTSPYPLGVNAIYKNPTVHPSNPNDWLNVSVYGNGFMGVKTDGTLWYTGLISGIFSTVTVPTQYGNKSDWRFIDSAGGNVICGLDSSGSLYTWGSATTYIGRSGTASSPGEVATPLPVISVRAGSVGFGFLDTANDLYMAGYGSNGLYGDGAPMGNDTSLHKVIKPPGVSWIFYDVGQHSAAAIDSNNDLWVWGGSDINNYIGSKTSTPTKLTPTGVQVKFKYVSVCKLYPYLMAIDTSGKLWAYGNQYGYQLGNGVSSTNPSPLTKVNEETNWSKVFCVGGTTFAIKSDGTLWGWGLNSSYNLGIGRTASAPRPILLSAKTNWKSIAGDNNVTIGLTEKGNW